MSRRITNQPAKPWEPNGRKIKTEEKERNGEIYVYEYYHYYDKEIKGGRRNARYLGIKNPETKVISKASVVIEREIPVKCDQSYGYSYVMNKYIKNSNLQNALIKAFGDLANDIITTSCAIAFQGSKLYLVENWQQNHFNLFTDKLLTSQRLSELLLKIKFENRNTFFKKWASNINDNEYLAYDITSISSYSKEISSVELGYNRDNESLPQINLGILHGEESKTPIFYKVYNGSIRDVSTITDLVTNIKEIGIEKCKLVMDKGFYSSVNNNFLLNNNYVFTMATPFTNKWAKEIINANQDIENPDFYSNAFDVYYKQTQYKKDGKTLNVHIYYDEVKKANETKRLNRSIQDTKEALNRIKDHQKNSKNSKYTEEEIDGFIKKYNKYFKINKIAIDVKTKLYTLEFEIDNDSIRKAMKEKGYLVIITNDYSKNSEEILTVYRLKEIDEHAFDDIKNLLDASRLNISSTEAMEGKMFLVFISLILMMYIRNTLSKNNLTKSFSYQETINELAKIKLYTYENGSKTISILSKTQKILLSAFSITESAIKAITVS